MISLSKKSNFDLEQQHLALIDQLFTFENDENLTIAEAFFSNLNVTFDARTILLQLLVYKNLSDSFFAFKYPTYFRSEIRVKI